MNTVGWNEEEHQYTAMDGADHTYVPTTQALTDDKGRKKRELSKDDTCKSR